MSDVGNFLVFDITQSLFFQISVILPLLIQYISLTAVRKLSCKSSTDKLLIGYEIYCHPFFELNTLCREYGRFWAGPDVFWFSELLLL